MKATVKIKPKPRSEDVYNIDHAWCPGCDQRLALQNRGCHFCGWKDAHTTHGRIRPVRHYLSVMAAPIDHVSSAWICRVFAMGLESKA